MANMSDKARRLANHIAGYLFSKEANKGRSVLGLHPQYEEGDINPSGWTLELISELIFRCVETELFVPGDWVCPRCSFRLHKRVMSAADGSVGVDASAEAEPCPNDGAPMQRLTWKQDAEEANRVALALMKELRAARERLEELEPVH
jgi:hypothetical protein